MNLRTQRRPSGEPEAGELYKTRGFHGKAVETVEGMIDYNGRREKKFKGGSKIFSRVRVVVL